MVSTAVYANKFASPEKKTIQEINAGKPDVADVGLLVAMFDDQNIALH